MKKYFLHNGKEQEGPFSLEDLKQKGVTYKTMVWFDGIQAWTEAQYIPELKEFASSSPPPFTKLNPLKETIDKTKNVLNRDIVNEIESKIPDKSGKKLFKWAVIILAVIGIIVIGSYVIKQTPLASNNGSRSALDSLVVINPTGSAYFSGRDNKWLLKVRGEVFNKSTTCTYKDFIIEIVFIGDKYSS
ncbi:MAG: DUF4339 domain-containing protein [Bacteroidetes bacterium]|nr:DUF4339 domain-containing protein [Bacteroidota bacterium]